MMKKKIKIASLVVSMLLLIGAVIGISAFADAAPSVEIMQKNIAYEGAVKTLFAIKAENADGLTVKVNFYDTDPSEEGAVIAYTKGVGAKTTIGDEEYDVVFSEGFRPKELRKSIFDRLNKILDK
jgi:ABC-type glycerol-3-phosphate transport system substrate-binding protein